MIDKSKDYKTRDGREVRIYATDGGGAKPIHGAVLNNGKWVSHIWTAAGFLQDVACSSDLIEVRPRIKREVWVNVYPNQEKGAHRTKESADLNANVGRIACVKLTIDCEEGEGL